MENPLAQGDSGSQCGFACGLGNDRDKMCGAAKGMEHERRNIKVSPKLDWRGAQKKVQCTCAIKAAEALLPGCEPKIDFENGKVCCKVAGKQVLNAEITHDYDKFTWRTDDIRVAL